MHTPRTQMVSPRPQLDGLIRGAISMHTPRTQMVSPRPQLDGLAVAEAPVGKRAPC
jgi:hypothetical protein